MCPLRFIITTFLGVVYVLITVGSVFLLTTDSTEPACLEITGSMSLKVQFPGHYLYVYKKLGWNGVFHVVENGPLSGRLVNGRGFDD